VGSSEKCNERVAKKFAFLDSFFKSRFCRCCAWESENERGRECVCACVFERVKEILCVREYVRVSVRECVGRCVKRIYSLLHLEFHSISISNLNLVGLF